MSKKCNQTTSKKTIIFNPLKEKSTYICPNCGEAHCTYISETGKKKVIEIEYSFKIGFLEKLIIMNCVTVLSVDINGKLENI